MTHMSRSLYRCLVQLHPPAFRRQFAPEMLWIFDEVADHDARIELFTDALTSLARQWIVRWAIQKLLIGELRFGSAAGNGLRPASLGNASSSTIARFRRRA